MARSRTTRRGAVVAALAGLLLVVLAGGAGAGTAAEASIVAKINAERAAHGLAAVAVDGQLTEVARGWTQQMIAAGGISHRPNLRAAVAGDPALVGENVGRSRITGASEGQLVDRLHDAFMASPGHRANVLGDWTHVGVSVGRTRGGEEMWVTVNFMQTRAPAAAPADDEIADADVAPAASTAAAADGETTAAAPAPEPPALGAPYAPLSPSIRAHFALHTPAAPPRHVGGLLRVL